MQLQISNVLLLSTYSKEYNFEGKSGTSYKGTFSIEGRVITLKMSKDTFDDMSKAPHNQNGTLTIDFSIYQNTLIPKVVSFEWI